MIASGGSTLSRGLATTCGAILSHACPCWSPSPSDLREEPPFGSLQWTRVAFALLRDELKQVLSDYGKIQTTWPDATEAYISCAVLRKTWAGRALT